MNPTKKILAPTDLSDLSQAGVRVALEMAADRGAEVVVYNVLGYEETTIVSGLEDWTPVDPAEIPRVEEMIAERRVQLEKYLEENFADLLSKAKARSEVGVGVAYQRIIEKAAAEGVYLIVMSTHGRTGFLHVLIGSVTEKVVRMAACPVLSVRPAKDSAPAKAAA
jgi:nucleotide-binding universal stress UspA family protein